MPVETRYFRNAKWNANYQLGTEQTTVGSNLYLRYRGYAPSGDVGFRIFKVLNGVETELTTDIIYTVVTTAGYYELTWDAPTDEVFDKIRVKVYLKIGDIDWTLKGTWETEQIGGKLDGGTWSIWAYCDIEADFTASTVYFYFGASDYNSRIENFAWTPYVPVVVKLVGDGLVWVISS